MGQRLIALLALVFVLTIAAATLPTLEAPTALAFQEEEKPPPPDPGGGGTGCTYCDDGSCGCGDPAPGCGWSYSCGCSSVDCWHTCSPICP